MFELKKLSREAVPAAMKKAKQYRLLNKPWEAESICRDILSVDSENRDARIILVLALTDQFAHRESATVSVAREALAGLQQGSYEHAYYSGVICERWARAQLRTKSPGQVPLDWLREALESYEKAQALQPPVTEDTVLRWNACVRLIERYGLKPRAGEEHLPLDSDTDVPLR